MKSAFIIHDSFSTPDQNWYPWLKRALEESGYTVYVPKFPTPEHQSLDQWREIFEPYEVHISPESIFIGHGTGCAFMLRLFETLPFSVRASFFLVPFVGELPHQALQLVNATFTTAPFLWKDIHEHMGQVSSFASDDDSYIPLPISTQASELLGTKLITISGANHFSDPEGLLSLPFLLEKILDLDSVKPSEEELAANALNKELELAGITLPTTTEIKKREEEEKPSNIADEAVSNLNLSKKEPEAVSTYYKDITSLLNSADTKVMATILRTEREQEALLREKKKNSIRTALYGFFAVVFIIATLFIIRSFVMRDDTTPFLVAETERIPSLLRVDSQSELVLGTQSVFELRKEVRNLPISSSVKNNEIHHIYPTLGTGTQKRLATSHELFKALEMNTPELLSSALDNTYLYGLYGIEGQRPYPFLLLTLDSFDRSFESMRLWEKSLARDLQDIFAFDVSFIRPTLYDQKFTDYISGNYNYRVLSAPRYTQQIEIVAQEHVLMQPPQRHILSPDVMTSLEEITETTLVFTKPDKFLTELSIGDIIIIPRQQGGEGTAGFLRAVVGFEIINKQLVITTRDANLSEVVISAPPNTNVNTRLKDDGSLEYYYTASEEKVIDTEGPTETLLLYTFLSDTQLLITTHEAVTAEIVERLSSRERDAANYVPIPTP